MYILIILLNISIIFMSISIYFMDKRIDKRIEKLNDKYLIIDTMTLFFSKKLDSFEIDLCNLKSICQNLINESEEE